MEIAKCTGNSPVIGEKGLGRGKWWSKEVTTSAKRKSQKLEGEDEKQRNGYISEDYTSVASFFTTESLTLARIPRHHILKVQME